ncbi:ADP-ribose pyrophosphatase YjhB, NUDIX family [Fodinibius salinus]|uniref:ADP-ribose pyrophosphatase YjhB, NUDIX family n=1 Tax=Fodinibius salinus TaxID=860790 RepID=A0A5D3YH26_9BACT|nr:NUDIX domain-containing protein [Fodinibius salinus]TYP92587.1 ADP-ribose pyrophosphatase YjhB, NUDIX family [Fodinibius salinus]
MESGSIFSHRLRTRVCGLLVRSQKILLTQIYSPAQNALVWMPPGGALKPGETLREALAREFAEETSLEVTVRDLLHINEFIESPFHAIEFFFEVSDPQGEVALGTDPELDEEDQLLRDIQWFPTGDLPEESFSPRSLLAVIRNWENRQSLPISEHK